ncbi:MAG TPA: hypothetical protein VK203_16450 [Nostocaceae cyanobacterium]|nr:hypothetical protein [Nostocaceae cyanobacterium]
MRSPILPNVRSPLILPKVRSPIPPKSAIATKFRYNTNVLN